MINLPTLTKNEKITIAVIDVFLIAAIIIWALGWTLTGL
jgi:hypothetical protein